MFVFGLIVGLVIGSVIAILVYHNNQKLFNDKIDTIQAKAKSDLEDAKLEIEKLKQQIDTLLHGVKFQS